MHLLDAVCAFADVPQRALPRLLWLLRTVPLAKLGRRLPPGSVFWHQDDADPDNMTYEYLTAIGELVGTESRGISEASA
eukprot:7222767-Pyramimonas_sp.AAC.1